MDQKFVDGKGCRYVINYAPADEALAAGAKILNLLGPGFEGLRFGFTGAVGSFLANPALGPQLQGVAEILGKHTQVVFEDGRSKTLSEVAKMHFRGRMGEFLAWLGAAIEHNLSDFLAAAWDSAQSAKARAEALSSSTSPSPAESTG